jgi:hypothetical protein
MARPPYGVARPVPTVQVTRAPLWNPPSWRRGFQLRSRLSISELTAACRIPEEGNTATGACRLVCCVGKKRRSHVELHDDIRSKFCCSWIRWATLGWRSWHQVHDRGSQIGVVVHDLYIWSNEPGLDADILLACVSGLDADSDGLACHGPRAKLVEDDRVQRCGAEPKEDDGSAAARTRDAVIGGWKAHLTPAVMSSILST